MSVSSFETVTPHIPTTNFLAKIGFGFKVVSVGTQGKQPYTGIINAPTVLEATKMVCKWESGLLQVAIKQRGEGELSWKFKGFGSFRDENHLLTLLDLPQYMQPE